MRRLIPHTLLSALFVAALSASIGVALRLPLPDGATDYNTGAFLLRHSWVKYAQEATSLVRDDLPEQEQTELVARFFALNASVEELERVAGDEAQGAEDRAKARAAATAERAERARIENRVERILEHRLTATARELGLSRSIGSEVIWPPVSIEFEAPPAVLVRSPRHEIRRLADRLVDGELSVTERERLESEAEREADTSALVVQIGAIAMYPAIIPARGDYAGTLETIAHEWVHHYLYFAPLGRHFYDGDRLVTLNETVANVAGAELGRVMAERYPLDEPPAYVSAEPVRAAGQGEVDRGDAAFDFGGEMRALRLEVDALLAAGRIDEAERLMDERRRTFAAAGYYIRRINQAYFAFHGSYADTPASSDPIGPKVQTLRAHALTLEVFLEVVRGITSEADLDALVG